MTHRRLQRGTDIGIATTYTRVYHTYLTETAVCNRTLSIHSPSENLKEFDSELWIQSIRFTNFL